MHASTLASLAAAAFLGALGARASAPHASAEPTAEPPLRARLSVGDEQVELELGGRARLADGRAVALELLPDRTLAIPGAFALDYPRGWQFSAAGSPDPRVGGWWTLRGDGVAIYLRRHAGDAHEVLAEYASNLEATGGRRPRPVTVDLGGRALEGIELDLEVGSIGPYPTTDWIHQVLAFEQEPGVSWLVVLQRQVSTPELRFDGLPLTLELNGEQVLVPGTPRIAARADPHAAELAAIARALRWD